jgi:hypothetical protein
VRAIALAFAALCLTGCATIDGISFGLDLANAETTVSFRHGDGKTVLAAEQDGKTMQGALQKVKLFFNG